MNTPFFLKSAVILLASSQFTILASCRLRNSDPDPGHSKTETRAVTGFSGIKASSGIQVHLSMGSDEGATVTAGENIIKNVKTEVEGGVLHIYYQSERGNIFGWNHGHNHITVNVRAKNIDNAEADSGSELVGENLVSASHLKINSSSGASLSLEVSSSNLEMGASSGSTSHLHGKASNCTGSASSGASIKAEDLKTDTSRLDVSSGASITISVSKKLDGNASSGGSISYSGSPTEVHKDRNSGGSVSSM